MHKIDIDIENNLLRVELEGFWTSSDFDIYISDELEAITQLRCPPGKHLMLCDLTNLNVVSQDLVENVVIELNSTGPEDPEWIAIVCKSALLKLQFQRLLTRPRAMIFHDAIDAEHWLLSRSTEK